MRPFRKADQESTEFFIRHPRNDTFTLPRNPSPYQNLLEPSPTTLLNSGTPAAHTAHDHEAQKKPSNSTPQNSGSAVPAEAQPLTPSNLTLSTVNPKPYALYPSGSLTPDCDAHLAAVSLLLRLRLATCSRFGISSSAFGKAVKAFGRPLKPSADKYKSMRLVATKPGEGVHQTNTKLLAICAGLSEDLQDTLGDPRIRKVHPGLGSRPGKLTGNNSIAPSCRTTGYSS